MSQPPSHDQLIAYFQSDNWKNSFAASVASAGRKLARARQVTHCQAETLDTGDIEITAQIIEKSGHQHEVTIALWEENGSIEIDTHSSCPVQTCCEHAAASIEHLSRPGRLESAFGGPNEVISTETLIDPTELPAQPHTGRTRFHLHIQ